MRLVNRADLQYPASIARCGKRLQKSPLFARRHVSGVSTSGPAKIKNTISLLEITGMQIMHRPHTIPRYLRYLLRKKIMLRS